MFFKLLLILLIVIIVVFFFSNHYSNRNWIAQSNTAKNLFDPDNYFIEGFNNNIGALDEFLMSRGVKMMTVKNITPVDRNEMLDYAMHFYRKSIGMRGFYRNTIIPNVIEYITYLVKISRVDVVYCQNQKIIDKINKSIGWRDIKIDRTIDPTASKFAIIEAPNSITSDIPHNILNTGFDYIIVLAHQAHPLFNTKLCDIFNFPRDRNTNIMYITSLSPFSNTNNHLDIGFYPANNRIVPPNNPMKCEELNPNIIAFNKMVYKYLSVNFNDWMEYVEELRQRMIKNATYLDGIGAKSFKLRMDSAYPAFYVYRGRYINLHQPKVDIINSVKFA